MERSAPSVRVEAPGVLVVGMHRSGTSAVARTLALRGLATARKEDLMEPTASNPTGLFESWSLTSLNDELLLALGGTWSAPPDLPSGWEQGPVADSMLGRAADTFRRSHPDAPWVWKDPRTCLTLPFWRRVLGRRSVVAVHRHPSEVARSLEARDGQNPAVAMALWGRYVREMLVSLAGDPVYVAHWDGLHEDPEGWTSAIAGWLVSHGIPARGGGGSGIEASAGRIQLTAEEREADPLMGPEDRDLFELLRSLEGSHDELPAVEIPAEPAARRALLEERRRAELAVLLRRGTAAESEENLRRYVGRLEDEMRRQAEAHAGLTRHIATLTQHIEDLQEELRRRVEAHGRLTEYVQRVEGELGKAQEVQEQGRAYARHLEEELRRKNDRLEELSRQQPQR